MIAPMLLMRCRGFLFSCMAASARGVSGVTASIQFLSYSPPLGHHSRPQAQVQKRDLTHVVPAVDRFPAQLHHERQASVQQVGEQRVVLPLGHALPVRVLLPQRHHPLRLAAHPASRVLGNVVQVPFLGSSAQDSSAIGNFRSYSITRSRTGPGPRSCPQGAP